MMMRQATTTLAMILAWAAAAQGQSIAESEDTDYPRFTVEVIIFEYTEEVSVGTERFLPDEPPMNDADDPADGGLVFEDTGARVTDRKQPPNLPETEFVLHGEDQFTMGDVAARLERLDVYKPVMHFAWTQVTRPEQKTRPIDLQTLAQPPQGLEGSFSLYLSRYLHLVVDLSLERRMGFADPLAIDDSGAEFRDNRGGAGDESGWSAPVHFRISEDRIFKSGDLRYFDHPKFGVLAKITRVEEPDDEVVEPG